MKPAGAILLVLLSFSAFSDEEDVEVTVRETWSLENGPQKEAAYEFLKNSTCSYLFSIGEEVPDPDPQRLSPTFPNQGTGWLQQGKNSKGQVIYFVYSKDESGTSRQTPRDGMLGEPMIYTKPPAECSGRKAKFSPTVCIGAVSCESPLIRITANVVCNSLPTGKCPNAKQCALTSNYSRLVGNDDQFDRRQEIFLSQKPRGGNLVYPKDKSNDEEATR